MTEKLSDYITEYLIKYCWIDKSMFDIVKLGIEVIISTIVNLLGVFMLGIICNKFLESMTFSLCFMTIRNYSGGYHATNRVRCNLSLWLVAFAILCGIEFVNKLSILELIVIIIGADICLACIGPLENKHKPLTSNIKSINRKYMIFWQSVWGILAVILYNVYFFISMTIVLTEIVIAILLIIEKGRCYYEKELAKDSI